MPNPQANQKNDYFALVRSAIKKAPYKWHSLVGIDTKTLAQGQGTPCPLCCAGAGEDRFHAAPSFHEDGAVRCRHEDKVYDAFDALVAAGIASTKLEAVKKLADFYGISLYRNSPQKHGQANNNHAPVVVPYKRNMALPWLKKKGVTEEAFRANGGELVRYKGKIYIGIPAYAPDSDFTQPVRWTLYDPSGKDIPAKQGKAKNICVKMTADAPKALMGLDGLQCLKTAEFVIKVEGPTDMLSFWVSIPRLTYSEVSVVGR